ncbi:MAG: response regulator [Thermodesulfovibrionia bacterium]|nr:response regulator [Thermodesulfovibrionia bacterium]
MKNDAIILIAEDDEGHAGLLTKNFRRAGVRNKTILFNDGEETLNFFFGKGKGPHVQMGSSYVLILDIRMPKVNGIEVLRLLKEDEKLGVIPVIMFTTTFDSATVRKCHDLGCSKYLIKPTEYEKFIETIKQLGILITAMEVPVIHA